MCLCGAGIPFMILPPVLVKDYPYCLLKWFVLCAYRGLHISSVEPRPVLCHSQSFRVNRRGAYLHAFRSKLYDFNVHAFISKLYDFVVNVFISNMILLFMHSALSYMIVWFMSSLLSYVILLF